MKPHGIELRLGINEYREDLENAKEVCTEPRLVACFGGSSISPETANGKAATELARRLAKAGICIISGGGDGIMSAANEGAYEVSPDSSYGLRVNSIQRTNDKNSLVIEERNVFNFNTLSLRLLTLISSSDEVVFFPGGFGTLEEAFSLLVRVKLKMMERIPIFFYNSKFWIGLYTWLRDSVIQVGAITPNELDLITIEDSIDIIADKIIEQIP